MTYAQHPQRTNKYAYFGRNPMKSVDPKGLDLEVSEWLAQGFVDLLSEYNGVLPALGDPKGVVVMNVRPKPANSLKRSYGRSLVAGDGSIWLVKLERA